MKPEPEANNPQRKSALPSATWLAAFRDALSEEGASLRYDAIRAEEAGGREKYAQSCRAASETLDGIARAINRTLAANNQALPRGGAQETSK